MKLLISPNIVFEDSQVQSNVDPKLLRNTILDIQRLVVLDLLGTNLYNDLLAKIQIDNTLVTFPDYKKLLDEYITPVFIKNIEGELAYELNYKFFNKSVGTQNADNLEPADLSELKVITDRAFNKAAKYATKLTAYLVANPTLYPKYLEIVGGVDTVIPTIDSYTNGLYLGTDNQINDYLKKIYLA